VLSFGDALNYHVSAWDPGGIASWWISNTVDFDLEITYYDGGSTAYIRNKTILAPGEYELQIMVYDISGNSLSGSFNVFILQTLELKLSGSFDYLLKEEIHLQLAALLTDIYSGEPVTGATVTFDIYGPDGSILVSGTFDEDTDPGVYIYTMSETMKDLKLPKGIYLVYARAISPDGFEAVDMIQFHIDPPGETSSTSLLYFAPIGVGVAVVLGTMIGGLLVVRKRRLSKTR
jgi:hypothetical protein